MRSLQPFCTPLLCASDCYCAILFPWKGQNNAGIKNHIATFKLDLECQVWSHADAGGNKTECSKDRKEVFAKTDAWCYKAGFVRTLIERPAASFYRSQGSCTVFGRIHLVCCMCCTEMTPGSTGSNWFIRRQAMQQEILIFIKQIESSLPIMKCALPMSRQLMAAAHICSCSECTWV